MLAGQARRQEAIDRAAGRSPLYDIIPGLKNTRRALPVTFAIEEEI
jgi:hypothetical protein